MPYAVNVSDEFETWFLTQDQDLQSRITATVNLLRERGPNLRRPYADTLQGSRIRNLKELRVQHRGEPYRILFAFDPNREAILLIGGTKAGDTRWYDTMIPRAEAIYQQHLKTLEEGD